MLEYLAEKPVITALLVGALGGFGYVFTLLMIRLSIWTYRTIRSAYRDHLTIKAIEKSIADAVATDRRLAQQRRRSRELGTDERPQDPLISALRRLNPSTHLRRYRNDLGAMGLVFEGYEQPFRGGRTVRPEDPIPEWLRRPEFKDS